MPVHLSSKAYAFTDTVHNDTYPDIDPIAQSNYSGKAVFVTGANKGLGRAYVIAYAKAGASYIAIGSRCDASDVVSDVMASAKEAGREPPAVIQIKIDVCEQSDVDAAADRIQKEWGRLDILVNNSGYMDPPGTIVDQGSEICMHTWNVNYWGTYRVTKALLPLMLKEGDKTVVFLVSIGALYVRGDLSPYSIAKFALCRLAEFLDAEYKDQGVVVYVYHPGGVVTDLAMTLPKDIQLLLIDTADLAANTLVFLTGEKRPWLAARYISANWDMAQLMEKEEEIVNDDLLKFVCKGTF